MILEPLKKPHKYRPVALVRPERWGMTIWTESDGEHHVPRDEVPLALSALGGVHTYCLGPLTRLRFACDARLWTAHAWKKSASSMELNRCRVHPLRGCLDGSLAPFEDLLCFINWAIEAGVGAASLPTMAGNLFRSTLVHPLRVQADPRATKSALFGGRQQAQPGIYDYPTVTYDLRAAYPMAMVTDPYPIHLRRLRPGPELLGQSDTDGLARAVVVVPRGLSWAPLPHRVAEEVVIWPHGQIEGTWALRELRLAVQLGCRVTLREAWVGEPHRFLDPWYDLMTEGRRLPGGAGKLGKFVSNALWGSWAMTGWRSTWTWPTALGDTPATCVKKEPPLALPQATLRHLAVETTARVRTRLLAEGLADGPDVVHVDTDGLITEAGAPAPVGEGWRIKRRHETLDVRAPQVYRYREGQDPAWHYVASGMNAAQAADWWQRPALGRIPRLMVGGAPWRPSPSAARRLRAQPPPPLEDRLAQATLERARREALTPDWLFNQEESDG